MVGPLRRVKLISFTQCVGCYRKHATGRWWIEVKASAKQIRFNLDFSAMPHGKLLFDEARIVRDGDEPAGCVGTHLWNARVARIQY